MYPPAYTYNPAQRLKYPSTSCRSQQSKSAIVDHALQYNHVIDWDGAKVLQMECDSGPGGYSDLSWTGVCRSSLKTRTHL